MAKRKQRGRRAWFKRFSQAKVKSRVDKYASFMGGKDPVTGKREPVLITLGSRNKAAQVSLEQQRYLDAIYPPKFNLETASLDQLIRTAKNGNPRAAIKIRIANDRLQSAEEYKHVWLYRYEFRQCKAVFTQDECTLVQYYIIGKSVKVRRSIVYPNIGIAKQHLTGGKVTWLGPAKWYRMDDHGDLIPVVSSQDTPSPSG